MEIRLLFPNQLYIEAFEPHNQTCILIEHPLFFTEQKFHVQKLMLHAVTMRLFCERLREAGKTAELISADQCAAEADLITALRSFCQPGDTLVVYDVVDDRLEQSLNTVAAALALPLVVEESPNFLTDRSALAEYRKLRPNAARMADFYTWQRKRMNVLVLPDGKPVGGVWSLDAENRKRLPKGLAPPEKETLCYNDHETALLAEAARRFAGNPGASEGFSHPLTPDHAEYELEQFLNERFLSFGEYEDAISENKITLYHSRLSAAINCGLLSPAHVIETALAFAEKHQTPLNSVEGFVRQIIGWREYMRATYVWFGPRMREANSLSHHADLPKGFWDAETGIRPLDGAIRSALATAYTHHIERLMVLGCFLLLNETHPTAVYDWFMALFIDAYDWVMVPNVYAMSQYADEGITTKPYLCGSNYILKMSNYPKEGWTEIWDGLYWRFIDRHRDTLAKNQRLGFSVQTYDRLPVERKAELAQAVTRYYSNQDDSGQDDSGLGP